MDFPEGKLERLHAPRVLVEQVAQVRRGTLRVGYCEEHPEESLCRKEGRSGVGTCEEEIVPSPGLGSIFGAYPGLTSWAIVCRPCRGWSCVIRFVTSPEAAPFPNLSDVTPQVVA
jgi:hypothetical protein